MPYIKEKDRCKYDSEIDNLVKKLVNNTDDTTAQFTGDLNYVISEILCRYVNQKFGKIRYWIVAAVSGVISNVGMEFYRRIAAPYENSKITENGDTKGIGSLL